MRIIVEPSSPILVGLGPQPASQREKISVGSSRRVTRLDIGPPAILRDISWFRGWVMIDLIE
jgi:hypothetical protein